MVYRHRGAEAIRTRERAARGRGGVGTAAWINEKRATDLPIAGCAALILLFSACPAFWCPNFGRWRPPAALVLPADDDNIVWRYLRPRRAPKSTLSTIQLQRGRFSKYPGKLKNILYKYSEKNLTRFPETLNEFTPRGISKKLFLEHFYTYLSNNQ